MIISIKFLFDLPMIIIEIPFEQPKEFHSTFLNNLPFFAFASAWSSMGQELVLSIRTYDYAMNMIIAGHTIRDIL